MLCNRMQNDVPECCDATFLRMRSQWVWEIAWATRSTRMPCITWEMASTFKNLCHKSFIQSTVSRSLLTECLICWMCLCLPSSYGLPAHVCEKCFRRLGRIEKAAEDLKDFWHVASRNYKSLAHQKDIGSRQHLKRTSHRSIPWHDESQTSFKETVVQKS